MTKYREKLTSSIESFYEKKYKDAWLISDRIEEAADNGIIFYEYMKKSHPDVNIFFVISKTSSDFKRLKKKGVKLIGYKTKNHKRALRYARVEISSFFNFSPFDTTKLGREKPLFHTFILHGMDQSDLSLHYSRTAISLFGVVTQSAKDFYKSGKSKVDVSDRNFQVTGMPRYDLIREMLKSKNEKNNTQRKNVVIAPTWRSFLAFNPETDAPQTNEYFLKSQYFRWYNELLNSPELHSLRSKYNITFLPHPELLNKITNFDLPSYINVETYDKLGTSKLYELAQNTKLFITDYTSTAFDFAFLGANIAYFNFDEDRYYSSEHGIFKSWYDIDKHGLGPSFHTIDELRKYISSEDWYRNDDNIQKIWKQVPINSSEVIYCEIKKIIED